MHGEPEQDHAEEKQEDAQKELGLAFQFLAQGDVLLQSILAFYAALTLGAFVGVTLAVQALASFCV